MEKLSYEMLLAPYPITLPFGTLRKPQLKEIYELSFGKYNFFQFLASLTVEQYFKELRKDQSGKEYWDSLSDEEKKSLSVYGLTTLDKSLGELFAEMFDYFLIEKIVYYKGAFLVLKESIDIQSVDEDSLMDYIKRLLSEEQFYQLLNYIRQICYISDDKKEEEEPVFKNDIAKKLYEKMQKAEEVKSIKKNFNFTLANIISKVSNRHPTINPLNVWELTVFQLFDAFGCMQNNTVFDLQSTRVAVWGDEKNKFDIGLWYENTFENK